MTHQDTLQRFLFDSAPARGALVRLDGAWQQVLARRTYPEAIRKVLGEMLAASQLLAANLKFDGTLIMQLQGQGALRLAVVETTAERTTRATARFDEPLPELPLAELLGEGGHFVLTLEPREGEPWQGVVALDGESIAEMLTHYMQRSEQLDTRLVLASNDQTAAGLLVQRLPEGHGEAEGWARVDALSATLSADELLGLDAQTILHRLFHEEEVRVFDTEAVSFACSCSRERVGGMLKLIGADEVAEVLHEQGSVEIACDFCNQHYVFDEEDTNELFGFDVLDSRGKARH